MPKSILVSNSNILGHSSVVVEPYGDPFIGDIIWSWNYFKPLIDKEIEDGKLSRDFWSLFDEHKEMMKSGNSGIIQIEK